MLQQAKIKIHLKSHESWLYPPLYHAQKRVSQISLPQTASFKETYHRSFLES
ncbi:hypothetical protein MICAC_5520011 [Microcystis aeruginosa PCC 9443]|uniref:Uncharacterized protein n=1 Tax=Microcystis aeruginosa PCC 9443 TaxID=1160281 RepID=I4G8L2_MICAE|nr:hypothetical protein MICAC_5520011 [Microcystis aeruginosa PCC 9443]